MWDPGRSRASESLCRVLDRPERVGYATLLILLSRSGSLGANDRIFGEIANLHFELLAQGLPARQ
jgi:hypothetical protein